MNGVGNRLAIGSKITMGMAQLRPRPRHEYSNNSWTQLGSDIDGEAAGDESGWSVAMNDNGISCYRCSNDGNGTSRPRPRL